MIIIGDLNRYILLQEFHISMVITESDVPSLIGLLATAFGGGWATHKFLRKDKKSKKELKLIAEMIVKSGVFSDWNDVFEKNQNLQNLC